MTDTGPGDLDCETAALYRAWLGPLFEGATDWDSLTARLGAHGYGLAIREGRLYLTRCETGRRFAPARMLGTSLRDLSARLGRPRLRARLDRPAAAEFVARPAPSVAQPAPTPNAGFTPC
ncbi:MAG TPA: hypothetical protein DEA05_06310 [Rhodobacteraceae bacterium]|nr:hypothetical protein [Paracoccaceae bacterium]